MKKKRKAKTNGLIGFKHSLFPSWTWEFIGEKTLDLYTKKSTVKDDGPEPNVFTTE